MSSLTFVLTKPSYSDSSVEESINMALLAASMDQDVTIIFINDGINVMLNAQNGVLIGYQEYTAKLGALSLYEINKLYICEQSLMKREVSLAELHNGIKPINAAKIKHIINQSDKTLIF